MAAYCQKEKQGFESFWNGIRIGTNQKCGAKIISSPKQPFAILNYL